MLPTDRSVTIAMTLPVFARQNPQARYPGPLIVASMSVPLKTFSRRKKGQDNIVSLPAPDIIPDCHIAMTALNGLCCRLMSWL